MKRVPMLDGEPPGLAEWRAMNPADDQATGPASKGVWNRFKESGGAYQELRQALLARQQGLCGYCEQRLSKSDGVLVFHDYQVEHVLAKSRGPGRALDWRNMLLCCDGGTWPRHKVKTRFLPGSQPSCGQAKGDSEIDPQCDPRMFDWHEPLVKVDIDGRMRANEDACRRGSIDPERLSQTIKMLEIDCERLRLAREEVAANITSWLVQMWDEAIALSTYLPESDAAKILMALSGGCLRPDINGHLKPFWTTERQYLGVPAEAWIHANPQTLNFE